MVLEKFKIIQKHNILITTFFKQNYFEVSIKEPLQKRCLKIWKYFTKNLVKNKLIMNVYFSNIFWANHVTLKNCTPSFSGFPVQPFVSCYNNSRRLIPFAVVKAEVSQIFKSSRYVQRSGQSLKIYIFCKNDFHQFNGLFWFQNLTPNMQDIRHRWSILDHLCAQCGQLQVPTANLDKHWTNFATQPDTGIHPYPVENI